jgi:hypothetical protein
LTFNPGPTGPGYVLGTDRNSCDIVLPKLARINKTHCILTCNKKRQLILKDCSEKGTIDTYSGKGGEGGRDFTWISGGERVPKDNTNILIKIPKHLKFQIVVSKHETCLDLCARNVDRFLQEVAANAELPIGRPGIYSAGSTVNQSMSSTANQSGEHTARQDPIYIPQGILGKGAFSVVNRVWDVSTGELYASKKLGNINGTNWRTAVDIMR